MVGCACLTYRSLNVIGLPVMVFSHLLEFTQLELNTNGQTSSTLGLVCSDPSLSSSFMMDKKNITKPKTQLKPQIPAKAKPKACPRSSLKSIEKNVVQKKTKLFEEVNESTDSERQFIPVKENTSSSSDLPHVTARKPGVKSKLQFIPIRDDTGSTSHSPQVTPRKLVNHNEKEQKHQHIKSTQKTLHKIWPPKAEMDEAEKDHAESANIRSWKCESTQKTTAVKEEDRKSAPRVLSPKPLTSEKLSGRMSSKVVVTKPSIVSNDNVGKRVHFLDSQNSTNGEISTLKQPLPRKPVALAKKEGLSLTRPKSSILPEASLLQCSSAVECKHRSVSDPPVPKESIPNGGIAEIIKPPRPPRPQVLVRRIESLGQADKLNVNGISEKKTLALQGRIPGHHSIESQAPAEWSHVHKKKITDVKSIPPSYEKIWSVNDVSSDKMAPPKPPRTFEHDEYMAVKQQKKKHKMHRKTISGPDTSASGHLYEEIPVGQKYTDRRFLKETSPLAIHSEPPESTKVVNEPEYKDVRHTKKSEHIYEEVYFPHQLEEQVYSKAVEPSLLRQKPPPRPPLSFRHSRSPGEGYKFTFPGQSVQVVAHNKHSSFIAKKSLQNPGYEKSPDIIAGKSFKGSKEKLKRSKSDECLYEKKKSDDEFAESIYCDPVDLTDRSGITSHGVALDAEGYAIPDLRRHSWNRQVKVKKSSVSRFSTLGPGEFARAHGWTGSTRRKSVREKLSQSFSVLRARHHNAGALEIEGATTTATSTDFQDEDGDSDVDMGEHQQRLQYVSSVREKHYLTTEWRRSCHGRFYPQLFDYCLTVTLDQNTDNDQCTIQVLHVFPDKNHSDLENIKLFCFPDSENWRPVTLTQMKSESFSFVLTMEDGARKYGFCRRFLPPGDGNRFPEVFCIISPISANNLYEKLLENVEKKRNESMDTAQNLLKLAYAKSMPGLGQEILIKFLSNDREKPEFITLERPLDERVENVSWGNLMAHLSVDVLLQIFASILLERKIIFTAQHLGTLSSHIQAIIAILYPFQWQHVFIPVLPNVLDDIVNAPTPFIIGMLSTATPKLQQMELHEVLIIDLDSNSLVQSQGDEDRILPDKLQRALVSALKEDTGDSTNRENLIHETFLRLFVETTGHYTEYLVTQQDGRNVFERELFCRAVSSKSIRMFLEWFTETQMFDIFINERIENGIQESGLFETRIREYREEMLDINQGLTANVKQLGRKMLNFVLESGGKLKKAFQNQPDTMTDNVYI